MRFYYVQKSLQVVVSMIALHFLLNTDQLCGHTDLDRLLLSAECAGPLKALFHAEEIQYKSADPKEKAAPKKPEGEEVHILKNDEMHHEVTTKTSEVQQTVKGRGPRQKRSEQQTTESANTTTSSTTTTTTKGTTAESMSNEDKTVEEKARPLSQDSSSGSTSSEKPIVKSTTVNGKNDETTKVTKDNGDDDHQKSSTQSNDISKTTSNEENLSKTTNTPLGHHQKHHTTEKPTTKDMKIRAQYVSLGKPDTSRAISVESISCMKLRTPDLLGWGHSFVSERLSIIYIAVITLILEIFFLLLNMISVFTSQGAPAFFRDACKCLVHCTLWAICGGSMLVLQTQWADDWSGRANFTPNYPEHWIGVQMISMVMMIVYICELYFQRYLHCKISFQRTAAEYEVVRTISYSPANSFDVYNPTVTSIEDSRDQFQF